jgi:hypothetical protein
MTRRLLVLAAAIFASLVLASPASASGQSSPTCLPGPNACSQTIHFTSNPPFAVPFPCSSLAGLDVISEFNGNGVFHINVNGAGDFWVTGTYTGAISVQPALSVVLDKYRNVVSFVPDPSRPSATGRVTDWFGFQQNHSNAVGSNTVNAQVTTSAGQSVAFHLNGHIQFSATGAVIRSSFDFHCA